VAVLQSLRVLDPSGVVLEVVGAPIQEYLRGRKDTVRGIVTLLTDDSAAGGGGESLYEELAKTATATEAEERDDEGGRGGDSEEEQAAAQAWEPDPVRGECAFYRAGGRLGFKMRKVSAYLQDD
jgi:anaphase-promoting complex subunit 2